MGSTAFALTVSTLSNLNHRPEKAIDFYFGGVAAGITTIGISKLCLCFCTDLRAQM